MNSISKKKRIFELHTSLQYIAGKKDLKKAFKGAQKDHVIIVDSYCSFVSSTANVFC